MGNLLDGCLKRHQESLLTVGIPKNATPADIRVGDAHVTDIGPVRDEFVKEK